MQTDFLFFGLGMVHTYEQVFQSDIIDVGFKEVSSEQHAWLGTKNTTFILKLTATSEFLNPQFYHIQDLEIKQPP